jgi:hypothetical protein
MQQGVHQYTQVLFYDHYQGNVSSLLNTKIRVGSSIEAGLPDISGAVGEAVLPGGTTTYYYGAFTKAYSRSSKWWGTATGYAYNVTFKASDSNELYGSSTTVTPTSIVVGFYIKYL